MDLLGAGDQRVEVVLGVHHRAGEGVAVPGREAHLSSVLERNVGADALRTFKRRQGAQTIRLVTALHGALPALSVAGAQRFVATLVTFQNGLFPTAHPPAAVENVLAEPEFAPFRTDDRHALLDAARLLLGALLSEDVPASGMC